MIEFFVPGKPVGKKRPRFARRGHHVQAYTPEETANYENLVAMLALEQKNQHSPPLDSAVKVSIVINLHGPKSRPKRIIYHKTKPDADNVMKSILDGMNGILFSDDAQAVKGEWEKRFSPGNQSEGVYVRVEYLEVAS